MAGARITAFFTAVGASAVSGAFGLVGGAASRAAVAIAGYSRTSAAAQRAAAAAAQQAARDIAAAQLAADARIRASATATQLARVRSALQAETQINAATARAAQAAQRAQALRSVTTASSTPAERSNTARAIIEARRLARERTDVVTRARAQESRTNAAAEAADRRERAAARRDRNEDIAQARQANAAAQAQARAAAATVAARVRAVNGLFGGIRGVAGRSFSEISRLGGAALSSARGFISLGATAVGALGRVLAGVRDIGAGLVSMGISGVVQIANLGRGLVDLGVKAAQTAVKFGAIAAAVAGAALFKGFQADEQLTGIENQLKAATGSAAEAREQLATIAPQLDQMGLSIQGLLPSFGQFLAAAKGTARAGDEAAREFLAVAKAGQALGLSSAQQRGALLALEQVSSKGKLQAQELVLQLGQRIPGAVAIAARALDTTTAGLYQMLEAGQVLADDFLPKFATQLEKEFGNAGNAVQRPSVALERLKNGIFAAFTEIGRNGGTKVLVDGMNALNEAIRNVTQGGSLAAFTRSFTGRITEATRRAVQLGRVLQDGFARAGRGRQQSDPLAIDRLTAQSRLYYSLGGQTADIVGTNIELVRRYASVLVGRLAGAFGQVRRDGETFASFLSRNLPDALEFIVNRAVPRAISLFQRLYATLQQAGRYALEFVRALGTINNGIGYQLRETAVSIGILGQNIGTAFNVSPQQLAYGFTYAAYLIGLAVDKTITAAAYLQSFFAQLARNGFVSALSRDVRDLTTALTGITLPSELNKAPDALADAFTNAYIRISDGLRNTFNTMKGYVTSFIKGFSFQRTVFANVKRDAESGNEQAKRLAESPQNTPDFQAQQGDDADAAAFGQGLARFADSVAESLPIAVRLAETFAKAFQKAGGFVLDVVAAIEKLVGTEAFSSVVGVLLGLGLLNKLSGGLVGGTAKTIASVLTKTVAGGNCCCPCGPGGAAGAAGGAAAGAGGSAAGAGAGAGAGAAASRIPGFFGGLGYANLAASIAAAFATGSAYLGKLNDSQRSREAAERARNAQTLPELLDALRETARGLGDADGRIQSAFTRSVINPIREFMSQFNGQKVGANGQLVDDGVTGFRRQPDGSVAFRRTPTVEYTTIRDQRLAIEEMQRQAAQRAQIAQNDNARRAAANTVEVPEGQGFGRAPVAQLTIVAGGRARAFTTPAEGFTEWSALLRREEAGRTGPLPTPFQSR